VKKLIGEKRKRKKMKRKKKKETRTMKGQYKLALTLYSLNILNQTYYSFIIVPNSHHESVSADLAVSINSDCWVG
jgi:predicted class III extradiol MEMO1 family dioxygenase